MSLPTNLDFATVHVGGYSGSIASSPVAVYARSPAAGYIKKITMVAGGSITVADCTLTVKNETSGTTLGTFTYAQSGSAAATLVSYTPDTAAHAAVAQDDVISVTPSGATGSSITGHFVFSFSPHAAA